MYNNRIGAHLVYYTLGKDSAENLTWNLNGSFSTPFTTGSMTLVWKYIDIHIYICCFSYNQVLCSLVPGLGSEVNIQFMFYVQVGQIIINNISAIYTKNDKSSWSLSTFWWQFKQNSSKWQWWQNGGIHRHVHPPANLRNRRMSWKSCLSPSPKIKKSIWRLGTSSWRRPSWKSGFLNGIQIFPSTTRRIVPCL